MHDNCDYDDGAYWRVPLDRVTTENTIVRLHRELSSVPWIGETNWYDIYTKWLNDKAMSFDKVTPFMASSGPFG